MKSFNISDEEKRKVVKDYIGRLFTSSNINWLIGSGFSYPVLGVLNNIEQRLMDAINNDDIDEKYSVISEFFIKCIYPQVNDDEVKKNEDNRNKLFELLNRLNDNRDSATLHKVINIFTTNYDILIERSLENLSLDFQDGFNGRIKPIYSNSFYGRLLSKQSNMTGKTFELPIFNLYKIHGSISWKEDSEKNIIYYSDYKQKLQLVHSMIENKQDFLGEYFKQLSIINPTKDKLQSTFLNTNYYDLLRIFSNELEKFNSALFVFGFSFADEHIKQLIERVLAFNPTMEVVIFVYDKSKLENFNFFDKYSNVSLVFSEDPLALDSLNSLMEEVANDNE